MSSHLKELADYTNNPVIHDQDLFFASSNQNPTMESEFKYQNIYYPSDDLDFNFLNTPFDHISDNPVNDQSKTMFQFQTSPDGENLTNQSPTTSREAESFISSSSNNVEDLDSSDPMFTFISQMLLEEKMEDEPHMFYDPLALKATEESLYDVLCQQYPGDTVTNSVSSGTFSADDISNFLNSPAGFDGFDPNSLLGETETNSHVALVDQTQGSEGLSDSSVSEMINSMFSNQESMLQFRRGLEEASKFLPNAAQLVTGLDDNRLGIGSEKDVVSVRVVENGDKGRKNHKRDDSDVEDGRTNKQSAIYVDETQESELSEMFDKVLLWPVPKGKGLMCCENPESGSTRTPQVDEGSNSGKGRAKRQGKQGKKNETPDLRTLLILCAQAVSSGDSRTANELLKQIRQHSSPSGDGTQRMAHYFANGLEARLAGSGTGLQNNFGLMTSRRAITAADMLKAYKTHLHACPFKKLSVGFANGTILKVAENASTLHIIDFGVLYGFQWPSLIQHLSLREGGPSKLRITGIELPQQGFRPTERIKETGRRLARYCERFGVPFEYNPIAVQNWETIKLEDLKINKNEVVAVNTLCRFKHLLDDTIEEDCPRDAVLNLIRKTNPNIFVHTIINGSYNAPFFLTRFKEAVYHFSSMFDKFDAVLTREDEERLRFEREFYGREIMNVVACEGAERVERPETYRQWQVRTMRAGFKQLPLDQELMQKLKHKMKTWYHKEFVIDEDSNWMLQGWKGRITYASSCWVPAL